TAARTEESRQRVGTGKAEVPLRAYLRGGIHGCCNRLRRDGRRGRRRGGARSEQDGEQKTLHGTNLRWRRSTRRLESDATALPSRSLSDSCHAQFHSHLATCRYLKIHSRGLTAGSYATSRTPSSIRFFRA